MFGSHEQTRPTTLPPPLPLPPPPRPRALHNTAPVMTSIITIFMKSRKFLVDPVRDSLTFSTSSNNKALAPLTLDS